MKQIIAMHGWCCDGTIWEAWLEYFESKGWIWQSGERGYGDLAPHQPNWLEPYQVKKSHRRVFIGHSLGPHITPPEILSGATDLIFICSFGRFIPKEVKQKSLRAGLRRMRMDLGTSQEEAMLCNFLQQANQNNGNDGLMPEAVSKSITPQGRKRLLSDLNLLSQTNGLPAGLPSTAKVLVVEGEEDSIVIPNARLELITELKKHLTNNPTHIVLNGVGHAPNHRTLIKRIENWLEG